MNTLLFGKNQIVLYFQFKILIREQMKIKNIFLLALCIVLIHCSKSEEKANYLVLSGNVINSSNDSLGIFDKTNKKIKTIYISKDSIFKDSLFVSNGYYVLTDWKIYKPIFLKNTYKLNATINYKTEEPTFHFKGIGSEENNYLNEKAAFDEKFEKVEDYKFYLSLNEARFTSLADSIKNQKIQFLKKFSPLDSSFLTYQGFKIEFENARFKERYQKWRGQFIKDDSFQVSPNFPNPYKNIDISNEKLLEHRDYLNAIKFALTYKINNDVAFMELSSYLDSIEKRVESQKIIDALAYSEISSILQGNENISNDAYSKFMTIVKNEKYKKELKDAYAVIQKNPKGKTSPQFDFYDINNKKTTLKSLEGKLVFIDIWATWCFPCIREIPAFIKLQKEFKNEDVYFVSMCLKDSKENFEKMVNEKNLKGMQLFAPDPEHPFFQEYNLKTIPRYILLDKEGKIIDAYAPKPSNPKLKTLLLENL